MPRTRTVVWTYSCDHLTCDGRPDCMARLTIQQGAGIETGRGTVIHDQADADAAARQDGWTVGRIALCRRHNGGAA